MTQAIEASQPAANVVPTSEGLAHHPSLALDVNGKQSPITVARLLPSSAAPAS
jgi:hypothetical protein